MKLYKFMQLHNKDCVIDAIPLGEKRQPPKRRRWYRYDVCYSALHLYIRKVLPKPKTCERCNEIKTLEVANIAGIYDRNLWHWRWYCRKCHMETDGRMNNLKQYQEKKKCYLK